MSYFINPLPKYGLSTKDVSAINLSNWENRPRFFSIPEGQYGIASTGAVYRFKRYSDTWLDGSGADVYGEWIRNDVYTQISSVVDFLGFTGKESSLPGPAASLPFGWNGFTGDINFQGDYIEFGNTTTSPVSRFNGSISFSAGDSIYGCCYVQGKELDTNSLVFILLGNSSLAGVGIIPSTNKISITRNTSAAASTQEFNNPTIDLDKWYWVEWYIPDLTDGSILGQFDWINQSMTVNCTSNSYPGTLSSQFYVGYTRGDGKVIWMRDASFWTF